MPGLWLSRGTGDVERLHGMHFQPAADLGRVGGGVEIDGQVRPPVLFGQTERQFRAAGDSAAIENQRGVAIEHVLFGARRIIGRIGLAEQVVIGNASVLGQATARTPAAVWNAAGNRGVQRRGPRPSARRK